MLDENDQNNLKFLLSLKTEKHWNDWADTCDPDDFVYALELVKTELARCELEKLSCQDDVTDISQAQKLLAKY